MLYTKLSLLAQENGFSQWAEADMAALVPRQEVRDMCRADRCGRWNNNWACPPACGDLEAVAHVIAGFSAGVLLQTTGTLADDFDYEAMEAIQRSHKHSFDNYIRQARLLLPESLPLSAGPCTVCRCCTYPEKPCRFPQKRVSSMEAYGLLVGDICLRSGLRYNYGPRTMTYTSCVLYNEEVNRYDDAERDIP